MSNTPMVQADELDFGSLNTARPQIVMHPDVARARRSDPQESHDAADRSQFTITKLRRAVLELVREEPLSIGSEINEIYKVRRDRREGWPRAAWDSPRKRAGELAAEGLLLVQGSRDGERMFIISAAGLDVIA